MALCDLCSKDVDTYMLEALPPMLRTSEVGHVCPSCSEWVDDTHRRMVNSLAPQMREAILQRAGVTAMAPWWRRVFGNVSNEARERQ